MELSDGRSVEAIRDAVFRQAVRAGAGAADIALWIGLLDRKVDQTIEVLVRRGSLRLQLLGSEGGLVAGGQGEEGGEAGPTKPAGQSGHQPGAE